MKYLEGAENLHSVEKRSKDDSTEDRSEHSTPHSHPVHRPLHVDLRWSSEGCPSRDKRGEDRKRHWERRHTAVGQQVLSRCLLLSAGAGIVYSNGGGNRESYSED